MINKNNKNENKNINIYQAIVIEAMPGGVFKVDIGNNNIKQAYLSGKMRKNKIRVMVGDQVDIEFSEYDCDMDMGRIVFRKINKKQ